MRHDTVSTLKTSIIFGALSLASGTTFGYICLALACASLAIYAVHHQLPSKKLARLEDAIKVAEGVLKRAKEDCTRDHVELMDVESHLLQAKLSASEIQSQMLEAGGVSQLFDSNRVIDDGLSARIAAGLEILKKYLQDAKGIRKSISKCRKEVEKIQIAALLTIQAERRRKLSEGIKEAQEVLAVIRSPTGHVYPARHRGQSSAANLFPESYMV